MACSSVQNSSSSCTKIFDVFVSFRGADTRNGFTDHLFAALQRKGVVAFRDNQTIKKGELLEPEILQAIEGSRVFIVVFSKDYASSTWCLKELTKIIDWVEETGRSVLPVFYDVTPSEVRKQNGMFREAFVEHEERFKDDLEMVQKWRESLKEITNRCGWDVQNKLQHEEIVKIVEEVINILGHNQILSFGGDLVDMHSRMTQLEDLLDLDANEVVRVVGVCGMGGIGKTTLVTALFNKISPRYQACCFIDDLSKFFGDFGPLGAQKYLLCEALNQRKIKINNHSQGNMMVRSRLCNVRILIVLDNVDQIEQLEKLSLHPEYLGAGSRIIIICRDSHILTNYGVNEVYTVQLLNTNEALQLLCRKAFKSNEIVEGYEMLAYDVLKYVNGLPLAIKVLGSFLFDRDVSLWRSALTRMKENPSKSIMDVLRISFDGLEEEEKEIFLDIACFFSSGYSKEEVKKLLAYRGFCPDIGIEVLIEKSLLSRRTWDILMHDLLKELGRSIVREKAPKEPRKWSRLWDFKDLHNIMTKNKEAKNLEAIVITQAPKDFRKTSMKVEVLSKMSNLKLLILKNIVRFSGILNFTSHELRYQSWDRYPFISLPSSFHADQLVELVLSRSEIKQLWKGVKYLPNLRILNLNHSKNLIEIPNLRGVPRLEQLHLQKCVTLVRIDPSIGILRELVHLNLEKCKNLVLNLNIIFGLISLEILNLAGCSKLLNNGLVLDPWQTELLEKVSKSRSTAIILSTSSINNDPFGLLLPYLSCFKYLFHLDLSFCNLVQIPDAIGNLHSLECLNLGGNKFLTLPTTIKQLSKLRILNLEHCKQLKYMPELPATEKETIHKKFRGLYVFDCPKLSDMEHCYSIVFSWMMQNLEVYLQSSVSLGEMQIVIPGTQIPRWFNKQYEGSSISIDPSLVMDDPNWLGVACCALFVAYPFLSDLDDGSQPHKYRSIGYGFQTKHVWPKCYFMVPILFKKELVTSGMHHLFTVFYSREEFIHLRSEYPNKKHDFDEMEFKTIVYNCSGLYLRVKNCGYRWIFKEDLQHLNSNIMLSRNSSSRKSKLTKLLRSD